nr:CHC2 zinc finger domain-containing protein [Nitrosomonas nitrosa]
MREHDHLVPVELKPEILNGYATTFIPRIDCYSKQQPKGNYITVYQPLERRLIAQHLQGQVTLGAYALDRESMAKWICLDADDEEQWQGLVALATTLQAQNITPYLETSRRGGHLWLFTPPIAGVFARRVAYQLLHEHNLEGIEVYPKQDHLNTGPGSLVRLPLGIHRKSGKRYHFITPDGQPLAPTIRDQLHILTNPNRIDMTDVFRILARIPPEPQVPQPPVPELQQAAGETLSERLKSRISVLDFVSQYVALDGRNTGLCPFHDDHTHSFGVNTAENYWHCFAGCGGGSIIDFWSKWREKHGQDSSFTATIRDLREILL